MFKEYDPRRPMVRVVAGFAGLAVLGWGLAPVLRHNDLHYQNWFGELVFAPFAILFGLLALFGALFKPQILGRPAARSKK